MASLLEQTTIPTRGVGLTSGVDYFGDVGQRQQVSLPEAQRQPQRQPQVPLRPPQNVTPAAPSLQVADTRAMNAGFQAPAPEPGFSGGDNFTGTQDVSPNPNLGQAIDTMGLAGSAAAATGILARDRGLYEFGSTLGRGANVVSAVTDPSARTLAPFALNELGVTAPVGGAITGAIRDPNTARGAVVGGLTSAIYAANPVLGAADILGQFGQAAFGVPAGERVSLPNLARGAYDYVGSNLSAGAEFGITPFREQASMLAEQERGLPPADPSTGFSTSAEYDRTYNTPEMMGPMADPGAYGYVSGGGADYDSPVGADAPGTDYSGYSAADMGMADGGMVGDMPGITKRYNNGGMVSGQPLLSIGYADGGTIGMGSKPTPAIVNKRVDAMLRDPRARQAMLARPQQLMASGELTPDEVTTMGRVAEAAMYNPELYPQLRQFVAQQGMTPLPATFDQSVIMRIMAIARALQAETPAGQVPGMDQAQMQRPVPGDGNGGYLQGPGTGRSDSIGTVNETTGEPVKVANGEYVIPAHVVRAKGREFFDNLLRRYSDVPKGE